MVKFEWRLSKKVDAIMDSECIYPITTKMVTDEMKVGIKLLERELKMMEASGKSVEILGTAKMYREAEESKITEAAVIEGEGSKVILISIGLLKKWDLD